MTIRKATIYALGEFSNRIGKALAIFLLAYLLAKEQYGIYNYILASSFPVWCALENTFLK